MFHLDNNIEGKIWGFGKRIDHYHGAWICLMEAFFDEVLNALNFKISFINLKIK